RGPFRAAELKRVERITPILGQALRRALASEAPPPDDPTTLPTVLLLNDENQLVRQSPHALEGLNGLDRLRVSSGSAHLVLDLASRARAGVASSATLLRRGLAPRRVCAVQLGEQTAIVVARTR